MSGKELNRYSIPVTKPFLPPREEYETLLKNVWDLNWLTNNGPFVKELEEDLKKYLGIPNICYVSNGTIALQIAIKALKLNGEIITTPFSYVATTSSIVWEGCKPVYVDIDPDTFNLDPDKIEEAITDKTSAIIATHVYGNPCDIEAIQNLADQYNLKVIYDAAHCFGVKYKGQSIYSYGNISTASFHATKLYHTIEGGALITRDPELNKKIQFMRNFGHNGPENFAGLGINGKNSEFHAVMGLVNLNYIGQILSQRKKLSRQYDEWLDELNLSKPTISQDSDYNYSYYPVLFDDETQTMKTIKALAEEGIQARRYFYPLLSKLDYTRDFTLPIAESIASRVVCLPLYHQLESDSMEKIVDIIFKSIR